MSAIVPVWNGAGFVREAVENILAQEHPSLEIIVIDDGSTDSTLAVAAALGDKVRYYGFPHRGLAAARNAGVRLARGEVIAFLDVDDLWSENKLPLQLGLLQEHPDILIVNGHTQLMRLVKTDGQAMHFEKWGEPALAYSFGSALIRRSVFDQVGDLDERHGSTIDLDWFLRAREANIPMLIHAEVVQYYRRHKNNMTNDQDLGKRFLLSMLKSSLARRSAGGGAGASLPPLSVKEDHA